MGGGQVFMKESKAWETRPTLRHVGEILEYGRAQGFFTHELADLFNVPESAICKILDREVVEKKYIDRIKEKGEAAYLIGKKMI